MDASYFRSERKMDLLSMQYEFNPINLHMVANVINSFVEGPIIIITLDNLRPLNNSISAYKHRRAGIMWEKYIYERIKSFLNQADRIQLWIAHRTYTPTQRPDPNENAPLPNPAYIKWSCDQLPYKIYIESELVNIYAKLKETKYITRQARSFIQKLVFNNHHYTCGCWNCMRQGVLY